MAHTTQEDLSQISLDEVRSSLGFSAEGLSHTEAVRRLTHYSYNETGTKHAHPFIRFSTYLWGPIPWMIEGAALLSLFVERYTDFGIIVALLFANALVGFWEEYQAGNAIAALKARLAVTAHVKRDNAWLTIPAREVVPGDILRLRIGEIVPADARLLDDRARGATTPVVWNMRRILSLAAVHSVVAVAGSLLLFSVAGTYFQLPFEVVQTLIYLKLSIAGHLTIFIARTEGPFWSHRPSGFLLGAVIGTQIIATLIAVYGVFMPPLGWYWALVVWGYALLLFLVGDCIKVWAYRLFVRNEAQSAALNPSPAV